MKLNRKQLRNLILKEMTGMDGGDPPQGLPPHLDIEDAYDESAIIDVMGQVQAAAANVEGGHGGLSSEVEAHQLVQRINMSFPDMDGIDAVAESLAKAAIDLMLQLNSINRRS